MPIWMRRNYINLINAEIKKQNKEQEAQQASHDFAVKNQKNSNIQRPDIKRAKSKTNPNIIVKPKLRTR